MVGKRKQAEQVLLTMIEELAPGSPNTQMYRDMLAGMSDEQFDEFIKGLKSGDKFLVIQQHNLDKKYISVERNLKLARKWGHEFFEKIWLDPKNGAPRYLSNERYLIIRLTLRRLAQILQKKISIPENNRSIDLLTGQPTGASKGSKISYSELQILQARDLPNTITELIKYRGGDLIGFAAMNDQIHKTGGASIDSLSKLGTETKSNVVLHTYLTSMHLESTLTKKS